MTKQEKIIVSAYTGVLMCDFDDVHKYIQEKLGRPVFTHELADKSIQKEVEEKSKEEFLEICNREEPEWKEGRWVEQPTDGRFGKQVECSECGEVYWAWMANFGYCPKCGARMRGEEDAD